MYISKYTSNNVAHDIVLYIFIYKYNALQRITRCFIFDMKCQRQNGDEIGILHENMKFIIGRTHVYSQIVNTYKY